MNTAIDEKMTDRQTLLMENRQARMREAEREAKKNKVERRIKHVPTECFFINDIQLTEEQMKILNRKIQILRDQGVRNPEDEGALSFLSEYGVNPATKEYQRQLENVKGF